MSEIKSGGSTAQSSMKSAGLSRKKHMNPEVATSSDETDRIFPSSSVEHRAMPHMKKHDVGDTGEMKIRYKVTSQNQYRSGEGHTGFDITHYEPAARVKGKNEKEMKDEAGKDEKDQPKAEQK